MTRKPITPEESFRRARDVKAAMHEAVLENQTVSDEMRRDLGQFVDGQIDLVELQTRTLTRYGLHRPKQQRAGEGQSK